MNRPRPCVSAALLRDGKVLLTRRSNSVWFPQTWCLPGGGVDGGEDWKDAVRREVFEEVGVRVEAMKLAGIYSDPKFHKVAIDDKKFHFLTACFLVTAFSGEPTHSNEVDEVGWFSAANLPSPLLISEPVKIADIFKFNGQVFVR